MSEKCRVSGTELPLHSLTFLYSRLCDDTLDVPEPVFQQDDRQLYFELLHVQPVKLNISFTRGERINAENRR